MTLIIYEKSRFFFLRTWISTSRLFLCSDSSRRRTSVSFASRTGERATERRKREKETSVVNKIPINLHYTINPMRGRRHSPFWIFPTLFPQDRYFCGRAPIRRTGKVPPPMEASRRSLLRPRIHARERRSRGDRSLFRVVHRIYPLGIRAGKYSTTAYTLGMHLVVTLTLLFS